ncbi:MAG: TPM domain-containing protein [Candidatus Limnocylindrales bacterium]
MIRPAGARRRARPVVAAIVAIAWAILAVGGVLGASPSPSPSPSSAPPPGPPYPEPVRGQAVYDHAGVLRPETVTQAEQIVDAIEAQTGVEVVVYTQAMGRDDLTSEEAETDAAALMDEWGVGRAGINDGLVILLELDTSLAHGQVQLYAGPGFASTYLSNDERQAIYENDMLPLLRAGDLDDAILVALGRVVTATFEPSTEPGAQPTPFKPSPGPPFPDPVLDRAVDDDAGILTPDAIVRAESVIDAIEARTGAEVVVYTQQTGYSDIETSETEFRARALIDQWHIGRAGFNDGMVVFFDIDPSLQHGQVQLYAAPGFEAAFLSSAERQAIYENDMLPHLRNADFDGALEVALRKVDAAATAEHAASLEQGRQLNAVLGLIGAPVALLGLSGWAFFNWRRYGKDPVYLDDPSILMPAPPPDLTAASGAMVMDGGTSRRALTTAMLDLASRGQLSFREEKGLLGLSRKVGIDMRPAKGDDIEEAQRARNQRRPLGPAEDVALEKLRGLAVGAEGDYITPEELPKFGSSVDDFDRALERHVVKRGWFAEAPSKVLSRWTVRGVLAIVAGVIALVVGWNVPISGLVLIGGGIVLAGVVMLLFARGMPAVTMPGAIIRAMLAAYRRTLQKTMAQARSMQQVVDEAGLDWLETPDQAVVWGTALGLQHEIEGVLDRSLEEARTAGVSSSAVWFPAWYRSSDGSSFASAAAAGSGGGIFSDSGMPDLGGMMSALGTIGNSPSSSGSGGGGFSGGSSGGGGGGAGGGF